MKVDIRRSVIVGSKQEDGIGVFVAQIREYADPHKLRITKDGAVLINILTKNGERCDVLLTPEEALQLGPLVIASACMSANEMPPLLQQATSTIPPSMIVNGKA